MSKQSQDIEFRKNNFYRDQYRRVLRWSIFLAIVAAALTVILAYMNISEKNPKYYATTTHGQVIQLHSLTEPVVTNKYILQWASLATRSVFNLDFAHYQQQMTNIKPYFTQGGWKQFTKALNDSGLLDSVKDKKLEMSAVVSGAPLIINRSVESGRYTWEIQLPVLITFGSANENAQTKLIVTMKVKRVPVLNDPKGIQISDFVTKKSLY